MEHPIPTARQRYDRQSRYTSWTPPDSRTSSSSPTSHSFRVNGVHSNTDSPAKKVPAHTRSTYPSPSTRRSLMQPQLLRSRPLHIPAEWQHVSILQIGVSNLPFNVSAYELYNAFSGHGIIRSIEMGRNAASVCFRYV